MKTKRNLAIVLTAVLVIASTGTAAGPASPPTSKETGLIGSWEGGTADEYLAWMAIHTPGSNTTSGEMLMNWVYVRSGLIQVSGHYPGATRLTPGHGVWAQTGKGEYKYTWYAYGMSETADGTPVLHYTARVTGLATMADIDNVSISYTYDVFGGYVAPQDMPTALIVHSYSGGAGEKRLTLATP